MKFVLQQQNLFLIAVALSLSLFYERDHDTDFFLKFVCQLSYNHHSHYSLWSHFCSLYLINLTRGKSSKKHKNEPSLESIDLDTTTGFISFFCCQQCDVKFW